MDPFQAPDQSPSSQPGKPFNMRQFIGALIGNWYWFPICVILFLVAAKLYIATTQPTFEMKAQLLVNEPNQEGNDLLAQLGGAKAQQASNFNNELNSLRSEELVREVVDSLHLNIQYFTKQNLHEKELYRQSPIRMEFDSIGYTDSRSEFTLKYLTGGYFEMKENKKTTKVTGDTWISKPYGTFKIETDDPAKLLNDNKEITVRVINPSYMVSDITGKLTIEPKANTSVVDFTYHDQVPQRGVDLLATMLKIHRAQQDKALEVKASRSKDYLARQKDTILDQLNTINHRADSVKRSAGVIDPTAQVGSMLAERSTAEKRLEDLRKSQLALLNFRDALLGDSDFHTVTPVGLTDAVLTTLVNQYNVEVSAKDQDSSVAALGVKNPYLRKHTTILTDLRNRMAEVLTRLNADISQDIATTRNSIANLLSGATTASNVIQEIAGLQQGKEQLQLLYNQIFTQTLQSGLNEQNDYDKSSKVIVQPYANNVAISPRTNVIYAGALAAGVLLPALLVFAWQILSNKIFNEYDLKEMTAIPLLGVIGKVPHDELVNGYLAVSPDMRAGIAEQFRTLRTNLEFISFASGKKIISVVSPNRGEGKTFIAANLGYCLALSTKRVVIVDLDLRKPRVADAFNLRNTSGVSEYLTGRLTLNDILKPSGAHPDLFVANCGMVPPNAADLLSYPAAQKLISDLQKMFDIVILDTSSFNLFSDAFLASRDAGLELFVIRQAYSGKSEIARLDELQKANKLNNPAIVFNRVDYKLKYGYESNPGKDFNRQLSEV